MMKSTFTFLVVALIIAFLGMISAAVDAQGITKLCFVTFFLLFYGASIVRITRDV